MGSVRNIGLIWLKLDCDYESDSDSDRLSIGLHVVANNLVRLMFLMAALQM